MAEKKEKQKISFASTQKYLDIAEIREDCVILRDGSLRAVLLVSSVNFSLKSPEEQDALVFAYRNFLNTLRDFPIQIVIQSRKLDIDNYIADLKRREKEQTNELLRIQMAEYIQYIQELVELGEIMRKRFFVVVPYNPLGDKSRSFFSRLIDVLSPVGAVRLSRKRFAKRREKLLKRVDFIKGGLESMGLKSVVLNTQSLIELFYSYYNPVVSQQEKLTDVTKIQVEPDLNYLKPE